MSAILILGATSPIARAAAASFAKEGHPLYLSARDKEELHRVASDLSIRYGVEVQTAFFDAEDLASHADFFKEAERKAGAFEGLLLTFGELGDHNLAIHDFSAAHTIITRNYTGACSILTYAATAFAKRKSGFIIATSSVAGERGRRSNYLYGSAKGGLTLFLEGLRSRLFPLGVKVITVKPGFVDTAMTFGMPGLFCVASAKSVGERIAKAAKGRKTTLYIPGFWRLIMFIIKAIPEPLFKRLKL